MTDAIDTTTAGRRTPVAGGPAATLLGMELVELRPGHSHVRMTVTEPMLNAYDVCHGGYVFMLADTAFGEAANAHGPVALATHAEIAFTAAVRAGTVLEARATELVRYGSGKRNAMYDVQVTDPDGEVCAQFRGTVKVLTTPTEAP